MTPMLACVDQVNTLRIITEQSTEFSITLYLLSIDFRRTFDTLKHEAIWRCLHEIGVTFKIINIVKEMYNNSICKVMHRGKTSSSMQIKNGLRQGCVLFPLLFNIVLNSVLRKAMKAYWGITLVLSSTLTDLEYTNDICILSHTFEDMKNNIDKSTKEAHKVGLKINIKITKEMRFRTTNSWNVYINTKQIEIVTTLLISEFT